MGSWSRLLTFCHGHVGLDVGVAVDVVDAQGWTGQGLDGLDFFSLGSCQARRSCPDIFTRECALICFEWVGRNSENPSRLATFQHTKIFSVAKKLVVPQANPKISVKIQSGIFCRFLIRTITWAKIPK